LHEQAFRYFSGSTKYVCLDNLKEGVLKPDIYEPELNPVYAAMLAHYSCVADPARVRDPDRKALVENGVKLLMRYQRFRYRRTRLTSLAQVNQALEECVKRINDRRHTRFGVSRRDRFEALERTALKPLPRTPGIYRAVRAVIERLREATRDPLSLWLADELKISRSAHFAYSIHFDALSHCKKTRRL
jgi:hypothetical protein